MASDVRRAKMCASRYRTKFNNARTKFNNALTMQNIVSKVYQIIFTNFTAYRVTKHFSATIKEKKMLLIIVQALPTSSVSNPARTKLLWTCFALVAQLKQVLRKK